MHRVIRTVGDSLIPRSAFIFAPHNSIVDLPTNTAIVSFTCTVRATINGGVINTGISNEVIPLSCMIGANRVIRILASSRANGNPSHS